MTIPSPRARRKARIEIIPLIDIIFFLLATFVMVSLSMVQNRGLPLNLPAAATSVPQEQAADFITLTIDKSGALALDRQPVSAVELPARLATLQREKGDALRVLIQGDEEAQLGHAISVLDECRRLGISKVTFQTRAPASTP